MSTATTNPMTAREAAQEPFIELIRELHWPDSLGLVYSAFT